jgi:hypothetical protein
MIEPKTTNVVYITQGWEGLPETNSSLLGPLVTNNKKDIKVSVNTFFRYSLTKRLALSVVADQTASINASQQKLP